MVLQYQGLFLVLALCTILHLRQVESFYTSSTSQFGNIGRTKKCTTIPSSIATTKPWQRQVQVIQQQINLVAKKKTTRIKSSNSDNAFSYEPVFDFSDDDNGNDMTLKFERIDDVIMGGVSSSTFKRNPNELFARWSGICRIDGGGFCGARSLPFENPLDVGDSEGFYLRCRLTSDNEPDRRIWKVTTRTENSRGERLYQAMFQIPSSSSSSSKQQGKPKSDDNDEWKLIRVPFSSFVEVSGPRVVDDGVPLDPSGGIYQIGMSLSKFQIAKNVTELPNFRPGYFELQLKEIGLYTDRKVPLNVTTPQVLSKEAVKEKRPLPFKILVPIFKLFFTEKRRRSAAAARILRRRGVSRLGLARLGFQNRARRNGILAASAQTLGIAIGEISRAILFWALRLTIVYPIFGFLRLKKRFQGNTSKQPTS